MSESYLNRNFAACNRAAKERDLEVVESHAVRLRCLHIAEHARNLEESSAGAPRLAKR